MLVTSKTRRNTRLQGISFTLLFVAVLGVLAYLSTRYSFTADWTANGRNTLSEASSALLARLDSPITITSYATEDEAVRHAVNELVARYQRRKTDISLRFVNPDLEPDTVRSLGIRVNGELRVEYQGRAENLQSISEQGLTNILQRLARSGEQWVVFIEGHGERKPQGKANHDLGQWVQQLTAKGIKVQAHNLVQHPQLPENTRVLVVAGPQTDLLPGEVAIINQYVAAGGNLLWLTDPDSDNKRYGLESLAKQLGIEFQPGMIVDPTTRVLGVSDPRFALVADYPGHAITRGFDSLTLFPQSHGLSISPPEGWQAQVLLQTEQRSWSETGAMSGSIQFDADADVPGPLTLGVALTRPLSTQDADVKDNATDAKTDEQETTTPEAEQRVVVTGDGDFLSNAYLGNGANLMLGMNMVNWLANDDRLINIPVKTASDRNLELSPLAQGVIGIGFLFVLPLVLVGSGFWVWWQRRKR